MGDLALPPDDAAALYLARGAEVKASRPLMTGDVFEAVAIPGIDEPAGLAMVISHPCAMRAGAHLRSHVMVCAVRKGAPIRPDQWLGNVDVMPLPDLLLDRGMKHRAEFDLAGRVPTASLAIDRRVACLEERGVALLLQRHTYSHTRYAPEVEVMHASVAHLLEEAALLEEWIDGRCGDGVPDTEALAAAEADFDALMRETESASGRTNRLRLRDPMSRAAVRRLVRQRLSASA